MGGGNLNPNEKMLEIFNEVADATKSRISKEKETNLSEGTYRMISLTQSLYNSINCYSTNKDTGINPFSLY